MIYEIESESDFVKALKESKSSDSIWQTSPIIEAREVGLIHSSGAKLIDLNLLMHYRKYNGVENIQPYLRLIKNCDLVRLKIKGIIPTNPTNYKDDGLQLGISFDGGDTYNCLDCESHEMNYGGFISQNAGVVNFLGGVFKDSATPKESYGFGHPIISSGKSGQKVNVFSGFFDNNRHHIMSSYQENIVVVDGGEFNFGPFSKHGLDRHGRSGYGGKTFQVKNAIFNNFNNYAYDFACQSEKVLFQNCKFARPFGKNGRIGVEINGKVEMLTEREDIALYYDNIYSEN